MPKSKKRATVVRKQKQQRTQEQQRSNKRTALRNPLLPGLLARPTQPQKQTPVAKPPATATPVEAKESAPPAAPAPKPTAEVSDQAPAPTDAEQPVATPGDVKSVACPRCDAPAGEQCVSASGVSQSWSSAHAARRKLAGL